MKEVDTMIKLDFLNLDIHMHMQAQVVRAVTIGRGKLCDVVLPADNAVSRLHTLVVPRPDGRIELRDLCSSSGTYIHQRGERVRLGRATLASGDRFEIGGYVVEVLFDEIPGESTLKPQPYEEDEDEITAVEFIGSK